ncbi:MAG: TRAM domain-containing protein [Terriglobales bacterium]
MKLIELAKLYEGKILTNDFNLNKVAQLQGVAVLNINELANSLKPIVLPGEIMRVFILKEGKEYNQGVAYLDDGTMVVVDNARKMIGKTIDISVTSVLQTTAGKMIFGKWDERATGRHDIKAASSPAIPVPTATVPPVAATSGPPSDPLKKPTPTVADRTVD